PGWANPAEPYVVRIPAVSTRSLTASGTPGSAAASSCTEMNACSSLLRARIAARASAVPTLGERVVDDRHDHRSCDEQEDEREEREAEAVVLPCELGVHQTIGSRARATKRSAR